MMIPTHRNNGLVLATLDDVRMKLGNDRAQEIERVTPVIKSLAAHCVRVSEIEELADLAIDEDSREYDMYDAYEQSSNHILASFAMLKIAGLTIEDLSEESRRIVRTLNASDEERKILRKNVIEIVWHKMKKKGIK